ncbi:hypothetical protein HPB51_018869 [Rhipicephalus microplus]|uniref:Secreted protein n=1 Tax=Rhipicephalus microplus TaxID=6941 RepID=A0A9J6DPQ8_RHIMP|nr:hypothetical protein HPB51_018869 [Rhipicephalus microplus]
MSLNGTLLCLVQVVLGFGAFERAQPLYASCDDTSQLISKGPHFSTLSSPDDAVLLVFPFKHHSMTSSFGTAIKEHRHDFVFCGHGGPKAAMSLNGTLLCLVQNCTARQREHHARRKKERRQKSRRCDVAVRHVVNKRLVIVSSTPVPLPGLRNDDHHTAPRYLLGQL